MSGESRRRLLFITVACSIAAIVQAYSVLVGDGGIWAVVATLGFSVVVSISGWQLWSRHRSDETVPG